jgi:hypothetical protein
MVLGGNTFTQSFPCRCRACVVTPWGVTVTTPGGSSSLPLSLLLVAREGVDRVTSSDLASSKRTELAWGAHTLKLALPSL